MGGSHLGGLKTAAKNKELHGEDFYTKIGRLGGKTAKGPRGFTVSGKASEAGRKGGKASRRKPILLEYRGQLVTDEYVFLPLKGDIKDEIVVKASSKESAYFMARQIFHKLTNNQYQIWRKND